MNRYKSGGPSKASATTLCQKCLKRGHYSYECTAAQQERPYVSRPSRTQQLLNPKLAPKITEAVPKPEQPKQIATAKPGPVRKRSFDNTEAPRKRSRSASSSSFDSVSTISTNLSQSPSRSPIHRSKDRPDTDRRSLGAKDETKRYRQRDSPPTRNGQQSRSSSTSSNASRHRDRRRRSPNANRSLSPRTRPSRRAGSPSPYREKRSSNDSRDGPPNKTAYKPVRSSQPRQRSMSPYSKRLALTQAKDSHNED